jgi:hypothetical protein
LAKGHTSRQNHNQIGMFLSGTRTSQETAI